MHFEPIAIIGQSCVLPGAQNPSQLWDAVLRGQNLLSQVPDNYWQLTKENVWTSGSAPDKTWSDVGGYVRDFSFDPEGFALPAEQIAKLDPLFKWTLHGIREALRDAGLPAPFSGPKAATTGVILGSLNYPTGSMTRYAESVWLGQQGTAFPSPLGETDARNRFCSGYPAQLGAQALGLGGDAFSLDAACASSFYAMKLACEQLQDRKADLMVTGATNRADDLFIHVGFCALNALSKRGQSTPFDTGADGLIPGEGAAFVVLKRLEDAIADGDAIAGVIRGIGLSNDGRSGGFLAPSAEGQVRAMRAAYAASGLDPQQISLLECHATGTPVGDAIEINSASEIFAGNRDLAIGSLKSNLGHMITVAGTAGLLKVLGAMKAGKRPPSINVANPVAALESSPLRLLTIAEPWLCEGPKRAGINAFGFGGNNAHLIVEEYCPAPIPTSYQVQQPPAQTVAIVAMEIAVGSLEGEAKFAACIQKPAAGQPDKTLDKIKVSLEGLRFPPSDLKQTLPQQLLILELARKAAESVNNLPLDNTSVFIGMGADPEIARYSARWRLKDWALNWADGRLDELWCENAGNAFTGSLQASGVVGTMPNIPANRINSQLDCKGPSFTVSGEELSGIYSLNMAHRALAAGEIDAAIVGAVDLSDETVHCAALAALPGMETRLGADAAVVLVLKRLEDAQKAGDQILATLCDETSDAEIIPDLAPYFGSSHAASALVRVAAGLVALRNRLKLARQKLPPMPWLSCTDRVAQVSLTSMGGQTGSVYLGQGSAGAIKVAGSVPRLHVFSGNDRSQVMAALERGETSRVGPARLVLIARDEAELSLKKTMARSFLEQDCGLGSQQIGPDIFWCGTPMKGELGFVFTGAAAAYTGMGHELLMAAPKILDLSLERFPIMGIAQKWVNPEGFAGSTDPFKVLQGCVFLSQVHAVMSQRVLGLRPHAMLGVSSGETNAMFASGAWKDMRSLFVEIDDSKMYTREIAGEYQVARRAWKDMGIEEIDWVGWHVTAPVEEVEAAVADEALVHLTMINSPTDCVIGGQRDGCSRAIEKLSRYHAVSLGHDIIAHAPEMASWQDEWYAIHHRTTYPVEGVRIYANSFGAAYEPTSERIAEALTQQAVQRVDFRKVVEAAWQDGVRIFVEHGPRAACSGWIKEILGDREHLAVSLDQQRGGLNHLARALAQLVAAGVEVNDAALVELMVDAAAPVEQIKKSLAFPAHADPVRLPGLPVTGSPRTRSKQPDREDMSKNRHDPAQYQAMPPAPELPHILPEGLLSFNEPQVEATAVARQPATTPEAPPAANDGPMGQIVDGMRRFHTGLSQTHQAFLEQQGRSMDRLLRMRMQMGTGSAPAVQENPVAAPLPQAFTPIKAEKPLPAKIETPVAPRPAKPAATIAEAPVNPTTPAALPGPKYNRQQLEVLASGKISDVLGPLFKRQDHFLRQVRMPMPPLLLADRVTGIDAEPGAMGRKATIWTETDVKADSWYLDRGYMPGGVMIESGQADLLLISYLGSDFQNQGERVYRLLGCELTYKGGLPKAGDTLCYDIHIDGYAEQGPIRLFFFHYDCRINGEVRLSVRNGQAGFFTNEELADSGGILWDPNSEGPEGEGRQDAPAFALTARSFSTDQVTAFSEGRLSDCFGPDFALTDTHTATPRIPAGRLNFLEKIAVFDPSGGPWGRGYLRAETRLSEDEWFFDGHFKDDPCMPGTLMLEGCYQTLAFYIAALGYTVDRDGWRFEPVPDHTFELRCRGQVTPGAVNLEYEVFVEEVHDGPIPTLIADVMCTVDGLKAFHGKRLLVRLVPAYPLDQGWHLPAPKAGTVAETKGVVFNYDALAACSWGRPSAAFGPTYAVFDGERRCARLPGPPYHFMTRVSRLDSEMGRMVSGGSVEVEYDIPEDAWYFSENGTRSMPYAVLLEAALQPCGWFASYMGCALGRDEDLLFRNLDGTSTQHLEIKPDAGTLTTRVKSTNVAKAGSMIIVGFEVNCYLGEEQLAYSMTTVFGFFNKEAFADQAGLPVDDKMRAGIQAPANFNMELKARPGRYFDGELRLPGPMLMLPDRVSEFSPEGGKAGLGRLRTEIDVNGKDWFFKSHFFGDSVQPGSLGIEAMLQTLQFYMLHTGMGEGIENPRFEPILIGKPMTWKYRGQVTPNRERVTIEAEILEVGSNDQGAFVRAEISYWVDGLRIYESKDIGMRIVSHFTGTRADCDEILDPALDTWLQDHSPTWTVPALPMMSMVDRLVQGALTRSPGRFVVGLENVAVHRWLGFEDGPRCLKVIGTPKDKNRVSCRLLMWHEQHRRYVTVASGDVLMGVDYLLPGRILAPAEDAVEVADPYGSGSLFHGPAFQILRQLHMGASGSSSVLDASCPEIQFGALNQGLLDGATHGIPHDDLQRWSERVPAGMVAYPRTLTRAVFYRPVPQRGQVRCETRFAGFEGDNAQFPCFDLQLSHEGKLWAEISLVEVLFPKGKIGEADGPDRRAFLRDRQFVPGLSLSNVDGQVTSLTEDEVRASDWLAGTLARTYASRVEGHAALTRDIAIKEHVAREARVHPAWVHTEENAAFCSATPLTRFELEASIDGCRVQVRGGAENTIDFGPIRKFWRERLNTGPWLGEDLFEGLLSMFLKSVVLEDPETFEAMKGKGALFIGNHQTGVESLIFSVAVSALLGLEIPVFAKDSHGDSWIGRLVAAIFAKPGIVDPKLLILVKREDPAQVLATMEQVFGGLRDGAHGLLVHAAGTRSECCRVPTEKLSATFVDKAVEYGVPIIPVRFSGGLPIEAMSSKIEFPIGYGKQEIHMGAPIWADVLAPLSSAERKEWVLQSLYQVGEAWELEEPLPGDPVLAELVEKSERGETQVLMDRALRTLAEPSTDTKDLLGATPFPGEEQRSNWLSTCADKILDGQKAEQDPSRV